MKKDAVLRIIDANLNRSREGLRVCEEVARFILNSPALTKDFKSARHRISNILKDVSSKSKKLFEARDTRKDVGRILKSKSEMSRRNYIDIFSANIERVKESLRVLEEFFKLTDKKIAAKFVVLRFKVYDIEKKAARRISSIR